MAAESNKILYFILGPVPTDAERAHAKQIGTSAFRNAFLADDNVPEICKGVAGNAPDSYLAKYPRVEGGEAIVAVPAGNAIPPAQAGAGWGTGHTEVTTPGGNSSAAVSPNQEATAQPAQPATFGAPALPPQA